MSSDAFAKTILGVCLDIKKLKQKLIKTKKERGCSHEFNEGDKFCIECGNKIWVEISNFDKLNDLFYSDELFNLDMAYQDIERLDTIYLGYKIGSSSGCSEPSFFHISKLNIEEVRLKIKEELDKFDLYDETKFGFYTIASY